MKDKDAYDSLEECCKREFVGECESYDMCAPTASPIISPEESPTTPSPTLCEEDRKWWYNGEKCSNYPNEVINGVYEFDDLQECCEMVFGSGANCPYDDVCYPVDETKDPTKRPTKKPARNPTKRPTKNPTVSPTTPSPTTCEERKWHFASEIDGCANTEEIDPEDELAFGSLEDCCEVYEVYFDTDTCNSYDMCAPTASPSMEPTTPSPTSCEEDRKWRPNDDSTMCTNAGESTSNDAYAGDSIKYDTLKECCNELFGLNQEDCMYEDVCNPVESTKRPTRRPSKRPTRYPTSNPTKKPVAAIVTTEPSPAPTPCEGRKWYLLSTKDNSMMCTNGYDIPPGTDMDFYDTMSECCDEEFDDGKCVYNDVCVDETPNPTPSPTLDPTPSPIITGTPTFGSTPTVSKDTTGPPTKLPDRTPKQWIGDGWSSDSWGGDRNDDPTPLSPTHNKCIQAERETCCNQPDSRSGVNQAYICDMLGCNLNKCGKRTDDP